MLIPLALVLTSATPAQEPVPAEPAAVPVVGPPPVGRRTRQSPAAVPLLGTATGAYLGGTAAYLATEAGESPGIEEPTQTGTIALGGLLGGAAGAGTAMLLTARLDTTDAQVAGLASGLYVGGFVGHNLAGSFLPVGEVGRTERVQAGQLAGTIGGAGIAFLRAKHARSVGSNLHLSLAATVGWQSGAGVSDLAGLRADDLQPRSAVALAGGAALVTTAALVGPRLASPQASTLLLAVGDGAWLGIWTPYLFSDTPTPEAVAGGTRLGAGAAYLGAIAMAGSGSQPSPKSAAMQAIGASAGNALGAGIPLALGSDGPRVEVVGPMLLGGAAGQIAGGLVAPHYTLSDDDAYLVGVLGSWTAYQTAGWATFSGYESDDAQKPIGFALTAGGAGTLLTLAAAPAIDVPAAASFELLANGGWGTWFAGWGSGLADLEPEDRWLITLAGGDVAIVGTLVAESAGFEPTWSDVGIVNGMGAVGAAAGGLLGVIALYDPDNSDPLIAATVGGSAVGLATGAVLASRSTGGSSDLDLPTIEALRARPSLAVRPWTDAENQPGLYLDLRLDEVAKPSTRDLPVR